MVDTTQPTCSDQETRYIWYKGDVHTEDAVIKKLEELFLKPGDLERFWDTKITGSSEQIERVKEMYSTDPNFCVKSEPPFPEPDKNDYLITIIVTCFFKIPHCFLTGLKPPFSTEDIEDLIVKIKANFMNDEPNLEVVLVLRQNTVEPTWGFSCTQTNRTDVIEVDISTDLPDPKKAIKDTFKIIAGFWEMFFVVNVSGKSSGY